MYNFHINGLMVKYKNIHIYLSDYKYVPTYVVEKHGVIL